MAAELALRGVRLVGGSRVPVDVGITAGMVSQVGTVKAATSVDGAGSWLMPGLVDHHVHLTHWAAAARRFELASATSARHAIQLTVAALAALGPGAEGIGYGFRDGLWPDQPLVADLDAATGERPIVLISADLHSAWLNSAALRRHGLATTDGLVREEAAFAVMRALEVVAPEREDDWVAQALAEAAARGVTRVVDLEMRWNLADWQRRCRTAAPATRVDFGIYPQDLDRAIAEGLRTSQVIPGTSGRVRVGPLKIITDGSLNTRTAWCHDRYPGLREHPCGLATVEPAEVVELLARARAHGLAVAVHAIGDRANQAALDAFAATGAVGSIEHAQLLSDADVARFAALGVRASVQPEHAMDDRDVAERYWPGRTARSFRLADLREAGVELAFGSDAPVAPLDPWVTMAAAVTRSRDGREPWHPEQAVDLATALRASTAVASVVPGAPADLVLLGENPFEVPAADLRTLAVQATMVGGEWSHRPASLR